MFAVRADTAKAATAGAHEARRTQKTPERWSTGLSIRRAHIRVWIGRGYSGVGAGWQAGVEKRDCAAGLLRHRLTTTVLEADNLQSAWSFGF